MFMSKYSVIDLFAGAGGLSLGFSQTEKYDGVHSYRINTVWTDPISHPIPVGKCYMLPLRCFHIQKREALP